MFLLLQVVVILFFLVLLCFCFYEFFCIKFGLDLQDLAPRDSYLRSFDDELRKNFNTYDIPVDIFFPTEGTPWWTSGYLNMIEDLQTDLIGD